MFVFFIIKQRKNKEKSPVKSSFNKEVCVYIYLQGETVSRTENSVSLNTDILNNVFVEKKFKKTEITVSLSSGPVMPEPSVEKRRSQ